MAIHPTAVVSPDAKIGENVEIGPYAIIEDNTVIGDGTFIDAHAKICRYTTIGKNSRIYLGALVGEEPQDHRMKPGIKSYTKIGDEVNIREYVTIHRSPFENGTTEIGNGTLLMAFCHVGHDAKIGNYVTCANHTTIAGHVVIEDRAVLSAYIMIHQFVRIGELAMLSPATKIRQDIPPYALVSDQGYVCGSNVVGLRRANLNQEERLAIKKVFKLFFFRGLNTINATKEFEICDYQTKETRQIVDFIHKTERGILPPDPELVALGSKIHFDE